MHLPVITVAEEGGYYVPGRNTSHPIRIYSDRRVQDDIYAAYSGKKYREKLSRREFRMVRRAAAKNRAKGLV